MSNSNEFLSTFNKLERHLKQQIDDGNHKPFYTLISILKNSNSHIRHYYLKLKEYGDLRNAIVHERIDGRVIAEPNNFAVTELNEIYEKITSPKKIVNISFHSVKLLSPSSKLSEALELMNKYDFSQVPIYDEKGFVAMLNSVTITNWMGTVMNGGPVDIPKTLIKEVLPHKRRSRVTLFRSRDIDVYELLEIYREYALKPERIDGIIITHSGKRKDKPLTIVTDHDILKLVENT